MLKHLCRRALKAPLRNLFRNPFPNPFCGPLQARSLHDELAPFSGPPSYTTLSRRFSISSPSPMRYYARMKAKENIEHGRFVDIHDIGGPDPKDYDVLITDIDHDTLRTDISKFVGIQYLTEVTKKEEADNKPSQISGLVYGRSRLILPCILGFEDKARWVFFLVDTGAPLTYISSQVLQAFDHAKMEEDEFELFKIAGLSHPVYMSRPDSHFSNLNILGNEFCIKHRLRPWVQSKRVTYYIGDEWRVVPNS